MNIENLKFEDLFTTMGTVNAAIMRRSKFLKSKLCNDIINQTKWMDVVSPTIGQRIKAIHLNVNSIKQCACGEPCALSIVKSEVFKRSCGKSKCRTNAQYYERTAEIRNKTSTTKVKNRKSIISDFFFEVERGNLPILPKSELICWISTIIPKNANKAIVTEKLYSFYKNELNSVLYYTKHIPIVRKKIQWSRRMYDIMNGIDYKMKCKCGSPIVYYNRIGGYAQRCHACLLKDGPTLRAERCVEIAELKITKNSDFIVISRPTGLNHGPFTLNHSTCDTKFDVWLKNGKSDRRIKCPKCDISESRLEYSVREFINKFYNTDKIRIGNREIDIYIPELNVGIEVNGLYWHSQVSGNKSRNYHLNKTKLCNENNIRLIHLFEDELIYNEQIVKNRLTAIIKKTKYSLYGRHCIIRPIDTKLKNSFLNKYHIQGEDKSTIKLGAFKQNRLVAVMTFGRRRFDKKDGFELIRYATIGSFNCVGVAGKILKHFEINYKPTAIISYADKRWSDGNLYTKLKFNRLKDSSPNYFYIKNGIRESRIKYQKHKLKHILPVYDSSMSEWQNMKLNGFDKIWDCGNMVFEKTY